MTGFSEFKKFFMFNLIGSLVIAALVAVITVLVGQFTEVTRKVLTTLFMVVIHSLICLAFVYDDEKQGTSERLGFFSNVLFVLVVLSFITSILGIWDVIPGRTVSDIYQTFFILGFAALHGNILAKALNKENYIDWVVYINYVFMGIVVLMLLPLIYIDNASATLGEVYYRILGAAGIIDGTLSILAIIFYKLYMHKHPKVENVLGGQGTPAQKKGLSIWVWILIAFLALQLFLGLLGFLLNLSSFR
ncbi:hypothetical protein FJZ18_03045 [Candidatus Pacearchaeota archaeon]|nr:hypothetical protein [Candidatus Pacearchaeota archaeon]